MPEFIVELYVSRARARALESEARRAAEELVAEGTNVRYVRSILVPEDETCFHLYEAESAADVEEAARRARLRYDRVAEAVTETSARRHCGRALDPGTNSACSTT